MYLFFFSVHRIQKLPVNTEIESMSLFSHLKRDRTIIKT